jgi:hypothetical protein
MLEEARSREKFQHRTLEATQEERVESEKFSNNPVESNITSGNMKVGTY